ncbi:MAG: alpha/beta fold hydrolase [Deltaproteobacteria bacterium]|nr:alpha/beta fold hydrolase [Deltaproteobacteria bacterium]
MSSGWLDRSEYPFASHFLEVEVGRLHYIDEGQGEPIVMVHGQPTWSFMYRHLIRGLSPRYRCIAIDHLGFGLSDKPAAWSYTPEAQAANLATLVEKLDLGPVHLLVHDWGGPIGLGWATSHPERVRRIMALDTWMWSMAEHRAGRWFSRIMGSGLGQLGTRRFNLFVDVFMKSALGEAWPAVAEAYRGPLSRPELRQGCALFPRMLTDPWLGEIWERRAALANIPARLIWGGADPAFPAPMRKRLASVFDHCEVEVHDGIGHFVAEELGERLVPEVAAFLEA